MEDTPVHTLPRACRIQRRPDFTLCYETGRRYFSRSFVLFVRQNQHGTWRLGLAVTKKMGNAVRRNRIKRVLREFFRLHGHLLPQDKDIVAVPKRELCGQAVDLALVRSELEPLLVRLGSARPAKGKGEAA